MRTSEEKFANPIASKQLHLYTLAATAGVGVLALSQPAEGKIVYTPAHHVIGKKQHYDLDLNHDKVTDFSLVDTHGCNTDYCFGALSAIPTAGNGVEGKKGFLSIPYAYALTRGQRIGPQAPFSGQLMVSSNMGTIGQWINVTDRYLGLKFAIKGKIHYGWARLSVQVLGNGVVKAILTGYAYETIPNKPIVAGKKMSDESTASAATTRGARPATLGMLAMGSVPLEPCVQKQ